MPSICVDKIKIDLLEKNYYCFVKLKLKIFSITKLIAETEGESLKEFDLQSKYLKYLHYKLKRILLQKRR